MRSWFVRANLGFITPASFEASDNLRVTRFDQGVTFEGMFDCYSRVSIGRLVGNNAVRALCMTFGRATLVPEFTELDERDLLHIPVLATKDMSTG